MIRVLLVEDQSSSLRVIRKFIKELSDFNVVGECGTVRGSVDLIKRLKPDLLLMDIALPDGTAFDILHEFNPIPFKLIFLTAYKEFAIKAIKYSALDYLLKPVDSAELKNVLNKTLQSFPTNKAQIAIAKQQYNEKQPIQLAIRTPQYIHIVELDEIMYCQSDEGYTNFFLADGRKITSSKYLKEFEDLLPPERFLRPHKSYLVNKRYLAGYHIDGFLDLKNTDEKIPVSERRRNYVIAFLQKSD